MTESNNFIINIIVRVIHWFFPQTNNRRRPSLQAIPIRNQHQRRVRRPRHIIDDVELRHNINRGRTIYRARQITAQNRAIAIQAEQALIDAIVQARQELEDRYIVHAIRTRNERPPERLPRPVPVDPVQSNTQA